MKIEFKMNIAEMRMFRLSLINFGCSRDKNV